jgi:hypothetical protein
MIVNKALIAAAVLSFTAPVVPGNRHDHDGWRDHYRWHDHDGWRDHYRWLAVRRLAIRWWLAVPWLAVQWVGILTRVC